MCTHLHRAKSSSTGFIWPRAAPASPFRQTHMDIRSNITTTTQSELSTQAETGLLFHSATSKLIMNSQNIHIKKSPVKTTTFKLVTSDKIIVRNKCTTTFITHAQMHTHTFQLQCYAIKNQM